ncbi:MAG: hypothetical protein ACKVUS_07845 [Saprospiraceae bacterium]
MLQQQKRVAPSLPISLAQTHEIKMEVVFGAPSQNCVGSGVCMIMNRLPRHLQLRCPHAPAWISFERGLLVFRFSKSEVVREDARSRFDSLWFWVDEPFQMPRHTIRHLGLPSHWVHPGLYQVEDTAKDWLLTFNLH